MKYIEKLKKGQIETKRKGTPHSFPQLRCYGMRHKQTNSAKSSFFVVDLELRLVALSLYGSTPRRLSGSNRIASESCISLILWCLFCVLFQYAISLVFWELFVDGSLWTVKTATQLANPTLEAEASRHVQLRVGITEEECCVATIVERRTLACLKRAP